MSDGKKLPGDREGHHAEEVHPQGEEQGERAREEEHPQDEEHHWEEGEQEVHPREEEEEEEVVVHPREHLEFVTGRTGPHKTRAAGLFPRPAPLNCLGRGVFFGIPSPCPRSGPCPTHTPDGSPLQIRGNKRGLVQGMSPGGPWMGAGRGLPEKYPSGPV